jgi:GNAT superfamily N-acetyltransferase
MTPELTFAEAHVADAGEILTVQRAAYVSEALLYNTVSFSAFAETLDEIGAAIGDGGVFVARLGPRVVGAVRGVLDGRDCEVARLVVAPDMQRRGIGARLVEIVEQAFAPEADRFWLSTGTRSEGNIRLYEKAGYVAYRTRPVSDTVTVVYLEKPAG